MRPTDGKPDYEEQATERDFGRLYAAGPTAYQVSDRAADSNGVVKIIMHTSTFACADRDREREQGKWKVHRSNGPTLSFLRPLFRTSYLTAFVLLHMRFVSIRAVDSLRTPQTHPFFILKFCLTWSD